MERDRNIKQNSRTVQRTALALALGIAAAVGSRSYQTKVGGEVTDYNFSGTQTTETPKPICWNNPGCPTVPPVTPVGPNLLDPKNCPDGWLPVLDEGTATFGIAHCEEDLSSSD
jgi:hypothetical protein